MSNNPGFPYIALNNGPIRAGTYGSASKHVILRVNEKGQIYGATEIEQASSAGEEWVNNETPAGAFNGVNTVYTTAFNYKPNSIILFVADSGEGAPIPLLKGFGYTETGANQITLGKAYGPGTILILHYIKA